MSKQRVAVIQCDECETTAQYPIPDGADDDAGLEVLRLAATLNGWAVEGKNLLAEDLCPPCRSKLGHPPPAMWRREGATVHLSGLGEVVAGG